MHGVGDQEWQLLDVRCGHSGRMQITPLHAAHLLCVKKQATKPQQHENSNGGISSLNECMELDHCLLKSTFPHCLGLNNLLHKSIFHSFCGMMSYIQSPCAILTSVGYIFYYIAFLSPLSCACVGLCVCVLVGLLRIMSWFLPRDAMHPRYSHGPVSVCLCLSVCHKSEFY